MSVNITDSDGPRYEECDGLKCNLIPSGDFCKVCGWCKKEVPGPKLPLYEPMPLQSSGTLIATMWVKREEMRKERPETYRWDCYDVLVKIMETHTLRFRDEGLGWVFKNSLAVTAYYPVEDFRDLCTKCICFDDLTNPEFDWSGYRRFNGTVYPKTYR